jgi:hypothetical protein
MVFVETEAAAIVRDRQAIVATDIDANSSPVAELHTHLFCCSSLYSCVRKGKVLLNKSIIEQSENRKPGRKLLYQESFLFTDPVKWLSGATKRQSLPNLMPSLPPIGNVFLFLPPKSRYIIPFTISSLDSEAVKLRLQVKTK